MLSRLVALVIATVSTRADDSADLDWIAKAVDSNSTAPAPMSTISSTRASCGQKRLPLIWPRRKLSCAGR
jgi:hypothetical protein